MGEITMWTAQHRRVLETLRQADIYFVKREYVEQKYQEASWVFREAYSYFTKQAMRRMTKPDQAESPIWLFRDSKWAVKDEQTALIKLEIPEAEILFFDMKKWNKILNLSYIGDGDAFEKKLLKMGVTDPLDIFSKPYFPLLKKEVTDSWSSVFQTDGIAPQYIQGAAWQLKNAWIDEVIF